MSDRDKCSDWVDGWEILAHWGEMAAWQAEAAEMWAAMKEGDT